MIKKYVIILNPIAGKGYAAKKLAPIRDFLENNKLEYEINVTKHVGHAIALAKEHGKGKETAVIAAGGDGTSNEVINGLMQAKEEQGHTPYFGVLPIGRGNDFSYGVGVPKELDSALEMLASKKTWLIDVGMIKGGDYPNGRYFGNGIGIGFDTIVGLEAAKMKHVHGAAAYALGAIKTFIKYPEPPRSQLVYNGKESEVTAMQISVMNGKRMGGIFFMAPQAELNDGLFDICISIHVPRKQLFRTIVKYTKGTQTEMPNIVTDKTAKITLKAVNGGFTVHADGETICIDGKELEISCRPEALNFVNGSGG